MSIDPQEVTTANVLTLVDQKRSAKQELEAMNVTASLEHSLKRVFTTPHLRDLVPMGLLHLLALLVSVPTSEAICETYGSMMERYHTRRHTNTGPSNEDTTLQKEMFVGVNGPPLHSSGSFVKTIVNRLTLGSFRGRGSNGNELDGNPTKRG